MKFDVDELARVAIQATRTRRCVSVEKFADGMHNKALLLTMDDGSKVVGKIPNPNAGRSHFITASEVATMDFVSLFYLFNFTLIFYFILASLATSECAIHCLFPTRYTR